MEAVEVKPEDLKHIIETATCTICPTPVTFKGRQGILTHVVRKHHIVGAAQIAGLSDAPVKPKEKKHSEKFECNFCPNCGLDLKLTNQALTTIQEVFR